MQRVSPKVWKRRDVLTELVQPYKITGRQPPRRVSGRGCTVAEGGGWCRGHAPFRRCYEWRHGEFVYGCSAFVERDELNRLSCRDCLKARKVPVWGISRSDNLYFSNKPMGMQQK